MKGALKDAEAREYLGASTRAWKRVRSQARAALEEK